jgi:Domain of unknown function (DUF4160)
MIFLLMVIDNFDIKRAIVTFRPFKTKSALLVHAHKVACNRLLTLSVDEIIIIQKIYAGGLPRSQLDLVPKWAALHNEELRQNWELARQGKPLKQIAPLKER